LELKGFQTESLFTKMAVQGFEPPNPLAPQMVDFTLVRVSPNSNVYTQSVTHFQSGIGSDFRQKVRVTVKHLEQFDQR
jgi:hypothetical protein